MTKKQNRSRGFGKRSLSVLLTVLLILSTLVVMLSATSLSASAAISYWNVAGDFNSWGDSLNNTSYRINSSAGDVTIPISSSEHSTITFKMVAYEDGWKWCGNSSGSMTVGSEGELSWNSGNDIKVNLPSNTVSVNFKIEVKNGKNYLTVTANTSGGGGGGGDTSGMFYDAGVNKQNPANTASNLFWATATYYDYMSDTELSDTQWLKPLQAGTHNFNGANDEWYPFYRFNREVVKAQADAQSNWAEPLYFGNFCDTNNAYDSAHHQNGYDSYGYREATNSYNVTRFVHIANNSDYNQAGSAHLANMNCSYQGLMSDHLSSSGDLLLPNGQTAPYFNASSLEGRAKVVNSSFPFKVTEVTDSSTGGKYKKYTFNSKNATDNVYFTWATDGNVTYPTGVNYGAGTTYGVLDGVSRFMNGGTSGYGIFPFNNASNNYKGTKTNANENLNYGFGIKTQVKFRVPAKGKTGNTSSNHTKFNFSGDDDLWMYITDEDGNSQLVLDMGGDHKESIGEVDFYTLTSTVQKVGASGGSKTKSFTFDYNKTYTMTVFYMERGLIESNCEMEFTLTPMGNSFIVTEEIDTVGVNAGLVDAVKQLSTFGFNTLNNGSQISDQEYGDFELGNGGRADIGDNALPINSNVKIRQYAPSNSYLTYNAEWDYYDNVGSNGKTLLGSGTGVTSNGQTTVTEENTLINVSGNEYDYAELQVDYKNTPQIGSFTVTKQMEGGNTGFEDQEFPATIYLQFKEPVAGTSPDQYEQMSTYDLVDDAGVTHRAGRVTLKPGQPITFSGVPIGTRVLVVEDDNILYTTTYSHSADDPYIVTDSVDGITVTNSLNNPNRVYDDLTNLTKKLDGKNYSGDLFNFNLDGLPKLNSDDSDAVDASDVHMQSFSVEAGEFSFENIPFDQAGTYRYRIYEDMDYLSEFDNDNDTTLSTDFYSDGDQYLVTMEVTQSGLDLIVGDPVFYTYSGDGTNITLADFDSSKRVNPSAVEFNNHIKTGKVKVEKQGPKNDKLNDVIFEVIKVDDGISGILASYDNDADRYDAIQTYMRTHSDLHASSAMTGEAGSDGTPAEDGVAIIADLPIYEDGFVTQTASGVTVTSSGTPVYQNYILIENSGPPNYTINKTINRFSFPINGQYELTFSEDKAYVNGTIKHPDASGPGMLILKIAGVTIILFSMALLGWYVLNGKKKAAQPHQARHVRRK
ncbi:MAG: fibro-slime domain-containing protein [Ruminococcus sp.]|uniref:fibro-slime domain-containing protein n=1 Tax=Ruminococcus sp. TaxID=41978 RepID=UPI002873EE43|nr:fibro-slime domain-containing protein [Ruminococcus sp.]MBQ3285789.1 fibro-slime domain-containing protein [Ruminococcus sp.]